MRKLLKTSDGFTLVGAMVAVVIMGIMLEAAGQSWQMIMKRERETELIFRGMQYRDAIKNWYFVSPGTTAARPPLRELKDLLEDPYSTQKVHYLRRLYKDPITNQDFVPVRNAGRIVGVKSSSEEEPLKKGGFPEELKTLADKSKYSEWEFNYQATTTNPTPLVPP